MQNTIAGSHPRISKTAHFILRMCLLFWKDQLHFPCTSPLNGQATKWHLYQCQRDCLLANWMKLTCCSGQRQRNEETWDKFIGFRVEMWGRGNMTHSKHVGHVNTSQSITLKCYSSFNQKKTEHVYYLEKSEIILGYRRSEPPSLKSS